MLLISTLLFFLAIALLILFVVLSKFIAFVRTRVPFVPTRKSDIEFIVKKVGINSSDVFYDLGSGNGKVVFLVEKLTGAQAVGFEMGWWTYLYSVLKSRLINSKARFKNKNFFHAPWKDADIIYCYLYPPLMGRIEEKFLTEMKPGSLAIVRDFPFPQLAHKEKYFLPGDHEIYVYRK